MSKEEKPKNKLNVVVKRINEKIAHAEAHGQRLEFAIKEGDPDHGFTAPETALAAFGSCILSNLNKGAEALGIKVDEARIEFDVTKRFEPLGFESV
ncbi:MAG: OsmC family protein [Spirochaetales bacterium]|nr:OsmC family protein [Spirochaetales bacterium]